MSTKERKKEEILSMPFQLPKSKHFQIERLADGVYAAVASEQGYAICNAGIIDIGDRTILFDTFISRSIISLFRVWLEHFSMLFFERHDRILIENSKSCFFINLFQFL